MKICMVACYMGKPPCYLDLFLSTCRSNEDIDFLVFGSHLATAQPAPNLRLVNLEFESLRRLIEQRVGFPVQLESPRKLCDFKPTYGHVLEEHLAPYDFWGHIDLDLILGRVRGMVSDELLRNSDIVSTVGPHWLSGAFTLFRNTPELRRLYTRAPTYRATFQDPTYRWFDESGFRWEGKEYGTDYLTGQGMHVSMWDLAVELKRRGELRLNTGNFLREYAANVPFSLHWTSGRMFEAESGEEVLGYHMVHSKRYANFMIPRWGVSLPPSFWISESGVFAEDYPVSAPRAGSLLTAQAKW